MKRLLVLAVMLFVTLRAGSASPAAAAGEVRTGFAFLVTIEGKVASYSERPSEDESVAMPPASPWRCVRRQLTVVDGVATGTFACASETRTRVLVSSSCGQMNEAQHNSVSLVSGTELVTLTVHCASHVFVPDTLGF